MKTRLYYTFVVGTAIALSNMRATAQSQNQPARAAVTDTITPTPAQRALALLKPALDKLSAANAFTFKTRSMVEVPSPVGRMINYVFSSEVAVLRPNKLASKMTRDGSALDLYYDGKTLSGVDQKLGLYAQLVAPATLDELIPFVMEKTGICFPSADMLYSDVYSNLTRDITHACWLGKSAVAGVLCDHLAFAAPRMEWQIWVGPERDPLPSRLMVTLLSMVRQPRLMVTFSDWVFKSSLSEKLFELKKPAGARQIAFRPLMNRSSRLEAAIKQPMAYEFAS
jgi:hypothetical protein